MFQEKMQSADQSWRTGESILDRAMQKTLQGQTLSFQEAQSALDRGLQERMQTSQFEFASDQQRSEFAWRSAESQMDRTQQAFMQQNEQAFRGIQANLDRDIQKYGIDQSTRNSIYNMVMSGAIDILQDPNLDAGKKPGAIKNLMGVADQVASFSSSGDVDVSGMINLSKDMKTSVIQQLSGDISTILNAGPAGKNRTGRLKSAQSRLKSILAESPDMATPELSKLAGATFSTKFNP